MFFLWPPKPQFEHFAAFLSFWGRSPLCGHVVLLCPGSQHIMDKRVHLLVPHPFQACAFAVSLYFLLFAPRSSYGGLSLRVIGDRAFVFVLELLAPRNYKVHVPLAPTVSRVWHHFLYCYFHRLALICEHGLWMFAAHHAGKFSEHPLKSFHCPSLTSTPPKITLWKWLLTPTSSPNGISYRFVYRSPRVMYQGI